MLHFAYSSVIHAPLEAVWAFHERPDAIERLTPPWQPVEVVSRTGSLEIGARVEFLIPAGPFKVRWIARHTGYDRLHYFVDEQISGPFRHWVHTHRFAREGEGTRLTDAIEFALPVPPLGDFFGGWIAKQQLRKMFRYRHEVTRRACESSDGDGAAGPL